MAGTYQSPQKKYYWKNRDKIQERTKEYKSKYNSLYFQVHKEELYLKRAERVKKARLKKKTLKNQKVIDKTSENVQALFKNP